jgi:hypothetical protein
MLGTQPARLRTSEGRDLRFAQAAAPPRCPRLHAVRAQHCYHAPDQQISYNILKTNMLCNNPVPQKFSPAGLALRFR